MSYSDNVIAAKARAMYGQCLTAADYDAMVKMATVAEVASFLKSDTHYRSVLAGLDEHQVHRGQLEASLRGLRVTQYARLIQYHVSQSRGFYHFLFLWEEIQQIIGLLRYIGAGSEGDYFVSYPKMLEKHCSYPLEVLARARSYQELLEVLAATPYQDILRRYPPKLEEQKNRIDLVSCERDLRTYYYSTLLKQIRREFDGETRKALEGALLEEVAAENLSAAYRLRRFFKNTPEEIKEALLPFETPWDRVIQKIVQAPGPEEMDRVLMQNRLTDHPVTDDDAIEQVMLRVREKTSRRNLRYSTCPPVVLLSYIIQMDIELENAINIIEAIRYNLPPAEVRKMLILSR